MLARSGNSGYSSGPHLHFVVQVNRGMRLESVPVKIQTNAGELRLPRTSAQPVPYTHLDVYKRQLQLTQFDDLALHRAQRAGPGMRAMRTADCDE